ncbi:hypothetical protein LZD49_35090 [Dyadobacter sp. CY261]|uniref:hypothetical protein n=1 Tax=Dyadobacter sp. CY261 TaxID=2907203 RepID=UPI001F21B6FB|nr:hypothetical protein [Dyadobacter sp. CY261]MCF0075750.1 hypothetical protein [Dyadobacter sp. CY261]
MNKPIISDYPNVTKMIYQSSSDLLFDEVAIWESPDRKNALDGFSENAQSDSAGSGSASDRSSSRASGLLFDDTSMVDRLNLYLGMQQAANADRMDCDCID